MNDEAAPLRPPRQQLNTDAEQVTKAGRSEAFATLRLLVDALLVESRVWDGIDRELARRNEKGLAA
jgi:hypothetical protein